MNKKPFYRSLAVLDARTAYSNAHASIDIASIALLITTSNTAAKKKIMKSTGKIGFAMMLAMALLAPMAAVQARKNDATPQIVTLTDAGKPFNFAIYANLDLRKSDTHIRRVIVFQHGVKRDADRYLAIATKLLAIAGQDPSENAVLAPNFATVSDAVAGDNMPLWHGGSWLQGQVSENGVTGISSFSVLDDLARYLTTPGRYPALKEIIFIGHSAGGQLMQRYAVLNNVAETLQKSGVAVRYIISSPSSYVYLDANRPEGDGFAPAADLLCPGYDNYRYGIENMIAYGQGLNGEQLFRRYAARDVTYLVGAKDNNPNHRYLDKSCGARLQGANRVERHRNYLNYEQFLSKKWQIPVKREEAEVPGAGHEAPGVFESDTTVREIFGSSAVAK